MRFLRAVTFLIVASACLTLCAGCANALFRHEVDNAAGVILSKEVIPATPGYPFAGYSK